MENFYMTEPVYSLVYKTVNGDCHKVSFQTVEERDLFISSNAIQVLFTMNEDKNNPINYWGM